MNIHKAGLLWLDILIVSSSSHPEVSREKGTPLRKGHFRCLITIWSIGIVRRGLNELLIVVKTSNSTKTDIFHFFFCL